MSNVTENSNGVTEFSNVGQERPPMISEIAPKLEEGVGVEPTYIRSAGGRVTVPPSLHYVNPFFAVELSL